MKIRNCAMFAATVLFTSAWIALPAAAGEQGGGVRKPCKPPKCGKVANSARNASGIETVEIKPTDTQSGGQTQSGLPTQHGVPKLSNDEQFPGRTHKLSNDEQFPSVKH